jgi:hypothetical protein
MHMIERDRLDGQGHHRAGGRIRAFRVEDVATRADARMAAFDSFSATDAEARALRAERRRKGGAGYDLLRHIGLVRRLKQRPSPAGPPARPTTPVADV